MRQQILYCKGKAQAKIQNQKHGKYWALEHILEPILTLEGHWRAFFWQSPLIMPHRVHFRVHLGVHLGSMGDYIL